MKKLPKKKYKKPIKGSTIIIVGGIIGILIVMMYSAYRSTAPAKSDLTYIEFQQMLENDEIVKAQFIDTSDTFKIFTESGESYNVINPDYEDFKKELLEAGIELNVSKRTAEEAIMSVISAMPMLILCFIIVYFVMKSVGGQAVTLFKVLKPEDIVTFKDVAGMSETKEEVAFAVSQLKNTNRLKDIGARPCKGIILEGPPGTGKTLMAKAIAGEAGVPFISTSGADFIEMFAGLGAARVRALWDLALTNAPCVVFIDEIDAVGRRRTSGGDGASIESNQTLNALLQRMDGLGVGKGVFVVAATNRISDLDPALLRPGRFDKHLYIGPPKTKKDRDEIIRVHMKDKKFSEDFDFDQASKLMFGLTGAEIEQVLNESVLISLRNDNAGIISTKDVDEAAMKLRTSGVAVDQASDEDIEISSVHEAGHAVMGCLLGRKASKVSIRAYNSGIGGLTIRDTDDIENKRILTKDEISNEIKVLLAGRMAEILIFGKNSAGCSNDIERASQLAYRMLYSYAMDDTRLVNPDAISKLEVAFIDNTNRIDTVNNLLIKFNNTVKNDLSNNIDRIKELADRLKAEEDIYDYHL